ncbi:GrpB family protein [Mycobacteroides abscessus]|uniref:GrpB family protein n=1 Tax=Mycobacteroides abscessus TaxID=36809 RepID=UPI0009A8F17F|nr:GrpB family protein [Mycobacteroides abscessus]
MAESVDSLDAAEAIAEILSPYQWHYVPPHLDRRHDRRFFVKFADGHRAAHLHPLVAGAVRWHQQVAFRDELRAHPDLVHSSGKLPAYLD